MNLKEEELLIRISSLIVQEMKGEQRAEDRLLLKKWLSESQENQAVYKRCFDQVMQKKSFESLQEFEKNRDFEKIRAKLFTTPVPQQLFSFKRMLPFVAAACMIIALGGVWYYNQTNSSIPSAIQLSQMDRLPAQNRATVTFSDGRQFQLNEHESQVHMDKKGVHYDDGSAVAETQSAQFATIETPRGGVYDVILPDGTRVKLNASTTLRYPTVFAADKREVRVDGEAYFEVAKRKNQPFIVETANQQVSVLGTHFNVNTYGNKSEMKTTLQEGKVQVKELTSGKHLILLPGYQSLVNKGKLISRAVDVNQELAWVDGRFNFDGKSLFEVMDDLSRWYNVDVEYRGEIPDVEFFGGTYRTSKLSTILKILKDQNLHYHFTANGKLIIEKNGY
ncbi:FecR domain-containing protein [Sphingobacterium sp. PCS056]|uniref:FecR family protein n=1 Tax=Sphingobacterium sp. PCS056 TaxID=2931400 RepID=UPI002010BFE8|nr:FecR family protein [Sphingobacterium sp. PCS056]UPZ35769.1 FecR domain-containing protein [Sphingobacterium sp. PCS056]